MRARIIAKLTHSLIAVLALVCVGLYGSMAADDGPGARRPALAGSSPADMAAAHDCWSGGAPRDMTGKTPGHVIVSVDGQARYAGPHLVRLALDQIFGQGDHGLTVHAFCR